MITILFQGNNFSEEIIQKINSASDYFSQVIVSTWKGERSISGLNKSVTVIELDDPGSDKIDGRNLNYSRHIKGVLNGLKISKNEYVLKVRSDFIFDFEMFLSVVDFERLNVLDVTTKIYGSFHFSDWLYFGKTEELIKMYSNIDIRLLKWCSIEEVLYINFLNNQKHYEILTPKIISHRQIKLKPLKKGYKIIPFGKNIIFMPSMRRINYWNEYKFDYFFKGINDLFFLRYIYFRLNQLLVKLYKCF